MGVAAAAIDRLMQMSVTYTPMVVDGEDAHGNPLRIPGSPVDLLGYLEDRSGDERLVGQETYRTRSILFLPFDARVTPGGVAEVAGGTYELTAVLTQRHPRTGEPHHLECDVTRAVG